MGSNGGEEWESRSQDAEKIYVAVRARPLNANEIADNDSSDWECINNTTIIFNNTLQERSMLPTAYTFDRVFGFNSPTKHVYEESAKKIALSVLTGINSTIFAYGQTGSGKTFTMRGITEFAIADIYDYIHEHRDRKFLLKFSAMEIYNEAVRDLLRTDPTPLRLLDDPERGTVVANLTEVTLKDLRQVKELLSICEAQRQIGETSLNELSSRSHQILRLTVESEAVGYMGEESSSTLTASVSFVDLAGSERCSQTLSAGTRLKEGGHINRSLLTLGTVIRKLSKGGKSGHIPYRDSKLTRMLQTSLGGNARTAIICTMSPAHSHVEQTRNTLHFANCAKQVHTNAQVNMVVSEKALVKQLQKELARMESELKKLQSNSHSGASKTALKEKELLIHKMDQEIRELTNQRDLAQNRVENLLRSGSSRSSKSWNYVHNHDRGSSTDECSASETSELTDPLRFDVVSRSSNSENEFSRRNSISKTLSTSSLSNAASPRKRELIAGRSLSSSNFEASGVNAKTDKNCEAILAAIMKASGRKVVGEYEKGSQIELEKISIQKTLAPLMRENSRRIFDARMQSVGEALSREQSPSISDPRMQLSYCDALSRQCSGKQISRDTSRKLSDVSTLSSIDALSRQTSPKSTNKKKSVNSPTKDYMKQIENDFDTAERKSKKEKTCSCTEEDAPSKAKKGRRVSSPTAERTVGETTGSKTKDTEGDWKEEFERRKREIINLWDACHIPLVHRSYFCLLFRGDPSDAVYMEVEHRRLTFLKTQGTSANDELPSSPKALLREREMLSRRMLKKLDAKEREALFQKWGIDIKSRQRRQQLCRKLWTDTDNMEHVNESAAIVAKLAGLKEAGQAPKEMFGLSLAPKQTASRAFSWRHPIPYII